MTFRAGFGPVVLLAGAVGGCAVSGPMTCRPDERRLVSETLYFGAAKQDGLVADAEWTSFLNDWVTPRFPEGLTAWPATGQWRGADGAVTRELSHVLNLVHPADAASEQGIRAIVAEYKLRFQQEAVLRVRSPACMSL